MNKEISRGEKVGRKIFISYKYADDEVFSEDENKKTVRDYVDEIEEKIDKSDHIYKGESDGEDLSNLSEERIWELLKNRIYDSSITIVMISKNMKESNKPEKDQWIPREISYSLKEVNRINSKGDPIKSKTNAILAVVIPDKENSYDYYIEDNDCCLSKCRTLKTYTLFKILSKNMFNIKKPDKYKCDADSTIYRGYSSYIYSVKWEDFIKNMNKYLEIAEKNQANINDYDVVKEIPE